MGGKAIKDARRVSAEEYNLLQAEILPLIAEIYPKHAVVEAYKTKPDFGDLDVVIQKPRLERAEFEVWLAKIGSKEVAYNQDNISFEYKGFQVDLIAVPEDCFDTAVFYYAYNDLNNLAGRIAHKFGAKFGWDGLTYQLRTESGHSADKIVLSKDPREIYTFLDLNYDRWLEGFETLEEIFWFIADSKYFNPVIFQYDNLNNTNRTRNQKRRTYQLFIEWLTKQTGASWCDFYQFSEDKSPYLIRLHNAFPEARLFYRLIDFADQAKRHEYRASKFNGHLIMEWTGLGPRDGKQIGQLIAGFKQWMAVANQAIAAVRKPITPDMVERSLDNLLDEPRITVEMVQDVFLQYWEETRAAEPDESGGASPENTPE